MEFRRLTIDEVDVYSLTNRIATLFRIAYVIVQGITTTGAAALTLYDNIVNFMF